MEEEQLLKHYKELQKKKINIDATRGKPCKEQLDLSFPLLGVLKKDTDFISNGVETRNYGCLDGIGEAKQLVAELLEVKKDNVLVGGNSSLNIMYDLIANSMLFGVNGNKKWVNLKKIKWLCIVPGYDRHFSITERMGIEMINVPLKDDGPDMDLVEKYVKDSSVKGMWCVPKFSNPTGTTYSDKVVRRIAKLKPAAKDFRVYWDNAYCVHDFNQKKPVKLLEIFKEASKYGNEDMIYEFCSFSKISFSGSGIAALVASEKNAEEIKKSLSVQTIGFDKINQLRHVKYFKNRKGVIKHMTLHAKILKPKFDLLNSIFEKEISNIASWTKPEGGYFICLKVKNCASQVIKRCLDCGVKLTNAGASFPYHKDPKNEYIRIAPSCLELKDVEVFADVVCTSVKIETSLLK